METKTLKAPKVPNTPKRVTVKDLELLVKFLKAEIKKSCTLGKNIFGIDDISNLQGQGVGPTLVIVADDDKTAFNWSEVDGTDLPNLLKSKGWIHKGSYDKTDYCHHESEENLETPPIKSRGVVGQFQDSHMVKVLNSRVEIVHNSWLNLFTDRYMHPLIPSFAYKLALHCPEIMGVIRTWTDRKKAAQFVERYIYNTYGIILGPRNFPNVIKQLRKKGVYKD